VKEVLYR